MLTSLHFFSSAGRRMIRRRRHELDVQTKTSLALASGEKHLAGGWKQLGRVKVEREDSKIEVCEPED